MVCFVVVLVIGVCAAGVVVSVVVIGVGGAIGFVGTVVIVFSFIQRVGVVGFFW